MLGPSSGSAPSRSSAALPQRFHSSGSATNVAPASTASPASFAGRRRGCAALSGVERQLHGGHTHRRRPYPSSARQDRRSSAAARCRAARCRRRRPSPSGRRNSDFCCWFSADAARVLVRIVAVRRLARRDVAERRRRVEAVPVDDRRAVPRQERDRRDAPERHDVRAAARVQARQQDARARSCAPRPPRSRSRPGGRRTRPRISTWWRGVPGYGSSVMCSA